MLSVQRQMPGGGRGNLFLSQLTKTFSDLVNPITSKIVSLYYSLHWPAICHRAKHDSFSLGSIDSRDTGWQKKKRGSVRPVHQQPMLQA